MTRRRHFDCYEREFLLFVDYLYPLRASTGRCICGAIGQVAISYMSVRCQHAGVPIQSRGPVLGCRSHFDILYVVECYVSDEEQKGKE